MVANVAHLFPGKKIAEFFTGFVGDSSTTQGDFFSVQVILEASLAIKGFIFNLGGKILLVSTHLKKNITSHKIIISPAIGVKHSKSKAIIETITQTIYKGVLEESLIHLKVSCQPGASGMFHFKQTENIWKNSVF